MDEKQQQKKQQEAILRQDTRADKAKGKITGAYAMQPITKPDRRFPQTNGARPSAESVEENRDWVIVNEK